MHQQLVQRGWLQAASAAICWLLLIPGCDRGHPDYFGSIRPLHPPDELWLNNSSEPEWIDPGKCSDSAGGDVIINLFAGLTELHPQSLEPMPDLARRWHVSDDGRTYTFFLRESQWSDGTPLTAHDFVWSWRRVLDPKTASKYSIIMYIFRNAAPFNQQALMITDIGDDVQPDTIQAWAEQVVPVSKVEMDRSAGRAFVFLETPGDDQPPLDRDAVVQQLSTMPLNDTAVRVAVTPASAVGVRAEDDHTLVVELNHAVPYFLSLASFYTYLPVPRHVIERLEQAGKNTDLWTRPENIVSNGAYKLVEWKFRQHMDFALNERYWNIDAPHIGRIKKVRAFMVQSYNTTLNLYHSGEIDFPGGNTMIPAEFMDHLRNFKDFEATRYLGVYFYWFNVKAPPMDNVLVRKALSLALDRESLTNYILRADQIPIASIVPDGLAGYQALDVPLFDPKAARAALAEAGYPGGQGLPQITLIYNTSETHKQVAAAAQQMWKDHLGIDVRIENQEWKTYLSKLQRYDFQLARMGWIGDYADPNTFLELFAANNGNNHSNWSDSRYDQLLETANQQTDAAKRLQLLREAEAYAIAQYPVLPIYVYTRSQVIKPYLRGIWGNDQDKHLWKYCWIDEAWYDGQPDVIADDPPPPITPFSE